MSKNIFMSDDEKHVCLLDEEIMAVFKSSKNQMASDRGLDTYQEFLEWAAYKIAELEKEVESSFKCYRELQDVRENLEQENQSLMERLKEAEDILVKVLNENPEDSHAESLQYCMKYKIPYLPQPPKGE